MKPHSRKAIKWVSAALLGAVFLFHHGTINAQDSTGPRSILTGQWSEKDLHGIILNLEEYRPVQRADDRGFWEGLPGNVKEYYSGLGMEAVDYEWAPLPASLFMEFVRTGNRSHYERCFFERRDRLTGLVLAELVEARGRFLDQITDGIWAICEETYWGVPAHLYLQKAGRGLPDVTEPTVDLFAAETGALLSWTVYLLEEALDTISPLIRERVRYEIDHRILTPCLERDDFWWQGFITLEEGGVNIERLNNWSPWIDSNWLTAVLLMESDPARRIRAVHKIMACLDHYLNPHPADGGCDEGPSYWSHAGGSVFHALELLYHASEGNIDVFGHPLIGEMGRYIYRAHINGPYFLNFADAAAKIRVDPSLIFRYGRSIGDTSMTAFGASMARLQGFGDPVVTGSMGRQLHALMSLDELLAKEPVEKPPADVWLPDIQVMAARSERPGDNRGSQKGRDLYLAAKGGHNHESHNHNDVGNFVVYLEGMPVIIDVGVETYSRKTFDPATRYQIWTMQSSYHNLPEINGYMQKAGLQYRAAGVSRHTGKKSSSLALDLAGAYPEEAGVESYVRTVTLNRGERVVLEDRYRLTEYTSPLTMHLMTPMDAEVGISGVIVLRDRGGKMEEVSIRYDPAMFEVTPEPIPIDDPKLRHSWGTKLTRIILKSRDHKKENHFKLTIE